MPDDDPAYQYEVKLQRGESVDDRDTQKAKVSADSIEELEEKVERARDKLSEWASDYRSIQPQDQPSLADDQATLSGGEAGD